MQPVASASDALERRRQVRKVLVAAGLSQPNTAVVQALLSTAKISHHGTMSAGDVTPDFERQPSPVLPGTPASEIIIAQRRSEL